MKSLLDPTFRYRPSFDTDLRRTFARIRRELPEEGRRSALATDNRSSQRIVKLSEVCALRTGNKGVHQ